MLLLAFNLVQMEEQKKLKEAKNLIQKLDH